MILFCSTFFLHNHEFVVLIYLENKKFTIFTFIKELLKAEKAKKINKELSRRQ